MSTIAKPRPDSAETKVHAAGPAPPLGVLLRVTGSAASPSERALGEGSCVIGAGAGADIIVDDKAVSRRHVELTVCARGVSVCDLESRNGTYYLGQQISKAVLSPGSRIRIGSTEISIDVDPSALDAVDAMEGGYRGLVGRSEPMRKLFAILARLEGSLVNVLIEGESGVGKELVARAIAEGSPRADEPYVIVNCGAIGGDLVRSELFGHKKGAFTGAIDDREGAFGAADGGTIFLDEIGELDIEVQPVLLRALESGEITAVGDHQTRQVSTRVVAATNRDLRAAVDEGTFREDLYYRLAVVKLRVPPLRERSDDIPLLAAELARQSGAGALPDDLLTALSMRSWRGNVRELRNAVQAYLAIGQLADEGAAPEARLELAIAQSIDFEQSYQSQKDAMETLFGRIFFERLLAHTGGNKSEAARLSKMDRSYLGKLLAKFGVKT